MRSRLRSDPGALDGCGPLRAHLALLLPELGEPPAGGDRPTLFEAVRCALAHLARDRHVLVILDDLQWSDEATLDLLSALAAPLGELPVLVIAAYRSDGLPRDHGIRRLRTELRRGGRLEEIAVAPLELGETRHLLDRLLGEAASPSLARAIHDRTHGVPFFVEELAAALLAGGGLERGRRGLELARPGDVPLPDTVRDAVLVGASELSDPARAAAEAAAVAGERFELDVVARLSSDAGLGELIERGLVAEEEPGRAAFRHALTREALYADVPWIRRRALHREMAEALEATSANGRELATHWLGAREAERARAALLRAARESAALHAHRDAAEAGRQALELWPERGDDEERTGALEHYAHSAELAGELAEAAKAWREVAAMRGALAQTGAMADAQRRLAAVQDLRGDREAAFASRTVAAGAYAEAGRPADAAVEHLAMANQLRLAASHGEAVELARTARREAEEAGRLDLRIRAQGLEGLARAKGGDYAQGLETVRGGLALALEHDLTPVAGELYQRLSVVLYDAADYRSAEQVLDTALALCRASEDAGTELACVTCMAYVLRERGEWAQAAQMCRDLIAAGSAVFVAQALLGAIHAYEGRVSSARRLVSAGLATASRVRHYNLTIDATASLARLAAAEGADDEARGHCQALLRRWEESDDHHYAVGGLRWASGFLARRGDLAGAHGCAEALSRIAGGHRPRRRRRSARARDRRGGAGRGRSRDRGRADDGRRGAAPRARHAVRARSDRAARRRGAGGGRGARAGPRAALRRLPHRPRARRAAAGRGGRPRGGGPRRVRRRPARPARRSGRGRRRALAP